MDRPFVAVVRARRALTIAVVAAVALVVLAVPAAAHGSDAAGVPADYRTTITSISPAVPGLRLDVVEGGSRLRATWTGPGELQVLGPDGEPYLRLSALGADTNLDSPASYRDDDRRGLTPVPPEADGFGAPRWQSLGTDRSVLWHEHRAHWTETSAPPEVDEDAAGPQRIRDWSLPLLVNGQPALVSGTLDYVPGPSPLPYLALAAVAAVLAVLALRHPRRGALACCVVVVADVVRVVGITATAADQPWSAAFGATGIAAVGWVLLLVAAVGLLRRRAGAVVLAAVGGVLVALTGAVPSGGDLSASLPLTALPHLLHRSAVAVALGAGLGLLVGLIAVFRRMSEDQGDAAATAA